MSLFRLTEARILWDYHQQYPSLAKALRKQTVDVPHLERAIEQCLRVRNYLWATEYIEEAEKAGHQVSPLKKFRCYHSLGDAAAATDALEDARKDLPDYYYRLLARATSESDPATGESSGTDALPSDLDP
jgi:hypothetical protein